MTLEARIGTSGWSYPHWVGPVYPENADQARHLAFYANVFDTVEINATFYHLPTRAAVEHWRNTTPRHFIFAVKASRYITHMKKLKEPEATITRFFEAISPLGDKLGPILFQLPPRWRANVERLDSFLAALPGDLRYAFEFRDPSWYSGEVYDCLIRHGATMCLHDFAGEPSPEVTTAGFVYVRLHGPGKPYQGGYGPGRLEKWAARIGGWLGGGRDVDVYFNNDAEGHAFEDARILKALLGDARSG